MILLDTCVVISAISEDTFTEKVNRWLRSLPPDQVWIPAMVVIEMVAAKTNEGAANEMVLELERRFRVLALDAPIAAEAGRLIACAGGVTALATVEAERLKTGVSTAKQVVRSDAAILASATATEGATLYSWDKGMVSLARRSNAEDSVEDVPAIPEQLHLPGTPSILPLKRPRRPG